MPYRGHKAQYEKLYAQYQAIKKAGGFGAERKAQKALDTANEYHEAYRTEIAMYEIAEKYLRDVMQGHFDIKKLPPITKWQTEREKLNADKKRFDRQYIELRNDTAAVEQIKRNVDDILHEETGTPQRKRTQDIDR